VNKAKANLQAEIETFWPRLRDLRGLGLDFEKLNQKTFSMIEGQIRIIIEQELKGIFLWMTKRKTPKGAVGRGIHTEIAKYL
jgi:hypothetical protein